MRPLSCKAAFLLIKVKIEELKMEFVEKKVVDGCRLGEIKRNEGMKQFDTPACMLYTRGGAAPHLTNNLVDNFLDDVTGFQVTLPTIFQHPGSDVLKEYGKGIAEFLDIKKHIIYCSVYDPTHKTQCSYNEEKNISVWNSSGRKKINVDLFVEFLRAFKPDIVQCLCDTVPIGQSTKRNKKSVDRTLKFLDEVLDHQKDDEMLKSIGIFGSIEGGDCETERTRSAVETAKRSVSGFVIEGIDSSSENWISYLQTSIKNIPRDKPRFLPGPVSPDEIFCALECGVDVFDSSFAYQATQRGCALNLQSGSKRYRPNMNHTIKQTVETPQQQKLSAEGNVEEDEVAKTRFEINLSSTRYKEDFSPLAIGCCCYSCTNHTRAYVYHLLQTKEMLAEVVLMTHNFHQYFQFFKKLRESINDDKYDTFKNNFLES